MSLLETANRNNIEDEGLGPVNRAREAKGAQINSKMQRLEISLQHTQTTPKEQDKEKRSQGVAGRWAKASRGENTGGSHDLREDQVQRLKISQSEPMFLTDSTQGQVLGIECSVLSVEYSVPSGECSVLSVAVQGSALSKGVKEVNETSPNVTDRLWLTITEERDKTDLTERWRLHT